MVVTGRLPRGCRQNGRDRQELGGRPARGGHHGRRNRPAPPDLRKLRAAWDDNWTGCVSCAEARDRPRCVRRISSRSNSASAAKMPNTRRPAAVVVSTCAPWPASTRRPMPRADRSCTVSSQPYSSSPATDSSASEAQPGYCIAGHPRGRSTALQRSVVDTELCRCDADRAMETVTRWSSASRSGRIRGQRPVAGWTRSW